MAAGDELGQRQLRLLPARQGARILERHLARDAEHAEQAPQLGVRALGLLLAQVVEHGAPGRDALVLLRVVTARDADAEPDIAPVRLGDADQHAQQAGLARAVEPEDEQTLAPANVEGHVLEHRRAAVALGQALGLEHDAARVGRAG